MEAVKWKIIFLYILKEVEKPSLTQRKIDEINGLNK